MPKFDPQAIGGSSDQDQDWWNQEDYFLTDQEWRHFYDAPTTEPRFDAPPTDHGNTVQPPPPQPGRNSESSIPTTTDQQWCDFRLEEPIDGYDELECAFIDLLDRMAATIRKISRTAPASPESKYAVEPIKNRKPWTEREHKLFLEGLQVYGDGDWTNIAKHFVKTRTKIQIASHARKHCLRQHGSRITKNSRRN